MTEATAVTSEGRITPEDLGMWTDAHASALAPIVEFVHTQGVPFGVQLAHAGRKASTYAPWRGDGSVAASEGGWTTVAPSPIAFGHYAQPEAMTKGDLVRVRDAFAAAARRAHAIGVDVVEIHAAHGYLLHQFLSPLSNLRDDGYGGDLEGRMQYPLEVVDAVRCAWPDDKALLLRVSATDWVDGGWDLASTAAFVREAKARGVDLVDVSTGGLHASQQIRPHPGYQVAFAAEIREKADVPTAAVGLITEAEQAEAIVAGGHADAVLIGRAALREPRWPLLAAAELGIDVDWPEQLQRGRPR